jgi:ASC-1-like (ASCH) protein
MESITMGLEPGPMERCRIGRQILECRLNKPKWAGVEVGTTIIFKEEPDRKRELKVKVLGVVRRNTFQELLEYFNEGSYLEPGRTVDLEVASLHRRYPAEMRRKHRGVVGFRFEVIRDSSQGNGHILQQQPRQ